MATVDIVERSWSGSKSGRCGGAFYFAQTEKCLMRMSPSGGVAKPAPSSMSTADEVPPPPVNGRTSFGRAGSSGNLPATCSYGSTCYVGPFGHVGTDPEADPAAATIDHGPHTSA